MPIKPKEQMTRGEERSMPLPFDDVQPCMGCKHFLKSGDYWKVDFPAGWRCAAFPDQDIPAEILQGYFDHRKPWLPDEDYPDGDRGFQFEDKDPEPYTWTELLEWWGMPGDPKHPRHRAVALEDSAAEG